MAEVFGNHNEYINGIDVKGDKVPDGFNENQIKNKARQYVESRIQNGISKENLDQLLKEIKQLLEKQDIERKDLIQELKQRESLETRENVDKEALIQEAKTMIYEKLGINENQAKNSKIENFLKGIVDELVIGNYELAIEIYNTNGAVIIDSLKQLASWEGLKKMAESLGETIWNLFDGNAYEKGKSVAQLGLIGTGVGLGVSLGKKGLRLGMKEIARLRPHTSKESVIVSPEIRGVVKETGKKIDEIVPKKQLDFSKMLVEDIAKLGDKERLEAGSFYLKGKKFTPEQEKAILEAHNVGKDRKGAGIYNYTNEEIKQKAEILKQAGFSLDERRILLEKGICGNESIYSIGNRLKPEQRKKLEKHGKELKEQEFYNRRLDLSEFEKLSVPEKLESLGIPKDFYDLLNESGVLSPNFDIIERYKKLKYGDTFLKNKIPIDYEGMINTALSKHPNLTRSEAFLVFAYTDNFLFDNLNTRLRKSGYETLSSGEKKLVDTLNGILLKMPQLEGKFIVRGDSWKGWITPNQNLPKIPNLDISKLIDEGKIVGYRTGDTINLHSFTSVSNNLEDIFIGRNHPSKDTLVIVNGERLRIRDISDLAMFTNFAENLGKTPTAFEGVILSDSKVIFRTSEVKDIKLTDSGNGEKYKQRVLQITVDGVK
ncbi:MAG: hypothetical protein PHI37_05225 [Candidatus Gracilibacteria bacterium]|nr:hypothetical protein [Candidatus Gracilibacteria bacterium]